MDEVKKIEHYKNLNTPGVRTLCGGEFCNDQREKNNIIDPKHDLQQRQRTERKPGVRIGYPCK